MSHTQLMVYLSIFAGGVWLSPLCKDLIDAVGKFLGGVSTYLGNDGDTKGK